MTPKKTVTIQAGDQVNEKRKIPEARRNDKKSIKNFHENAEKKFLVNYVNYRWRRIMSQLNFEGFILDFSFVFYKKERYFLRRVKFVKSIKIFVIFTDFKTEGPWCKN